MNIYRGRTINEFSLASLLYDAIDDSNLNAITTLLEKGADPNLVVQKYGIASIHLAVGTSPSDFSYQITELILQNGGNPNVRSDDGLTPLHIAAAWGRYDILKLLLNYSGDPELHDSDNMTPSDYAYREENLECYQLLNEYTPDKNDLLDACKESQEDYELVLDKIIVNNETTIGEYQIMNEYKVDIDNNWKDDCEILKNLPNTNTTEFITKWFQNLECTAKFDEITQDNLDNLEMEKDHSFLNKSFCFTIPKIVVKDPNDISVSWDCSFMREESGIFPLQSTQNESENISKKEGVSSDYVTCSSNSSIVSEDFKRRTSLDSKSDGISSTDSQKTFISVSEIYKYVDKNQGVVLYEKRLLKSSLCDNIQKSATSSNNSLPEILDYDTDTLRKELTAQGFNPGPITTTTKNVYLKKLSQLKTNPLPIIPRSIYQKPKVYSVELQRTLFQYDWNDHMNIYKTLEDAVINEFTKIDSTKKWREGVNKSSFTYLLLDPRITNNLPYRADNLSHNQIWNYFLSAIFYVGKGKRNRPYSHLYEALSVWNKGERQVDDRKLNYILDIWKDNLGVICLHVFQNVIPVEAYTREAAMIEAIKLENLCNAKLGDFYGITYSWPQKNKKMLGVYLLYKAMQIFLIEGERQLCPTDIN